MSILFPITVTVIAGYFYIKWFVSKKREEQVEHFKNLG